MSKTGLAVAVAKAECQGLRPDCTNITEREYSIGMFQINLAEGYGKGKWIHAGKVPGRTIEEKAEWLKDPRNNTIMAKIIKDQNGSWKPWSAYTSKRYLEHLE